eukprot:156045-Amphidinium_carterae.2
MSTSPVRSSTAQQSMSRTQNEQINSALDKENYKTISENGNPQTRTSTQLKLAATSNSTIEMKP